MHDMNQDSATSLYPVVEFASETYELDEFGCSSIFLLVGSEKALVIDTGVGVGNLRRAVERITDKPTVCVCTHGHLDHIQNAWQFQECYINTRDRPLMVDDVQRRRQYVERIAGRYTGPVFFPYDLDRDVCPWGGQPEVHELDVEQVFELGGRRVTAYMTPGHTPGSMSLLDEQSETLFVGDALNNNLLLSGVMESGSVDPVTWGDVLTGLRTMEWLVAEGRCRGLYNAHHDYRALGMPLGEDVLPSCVAIVQRISEGRAVTEPMDNPLDTSAAMTVVRHNKSWVSVPLDKGATLLGRHEGDRSHE